jgi:glycosyltransferase involved in cell wall biosynthesis
VVFIGEVPNQAVPAYLAVADLCLALFPVNVVTMCKSPLKVFEYMAAGKPVLARAVGEIARCLEEGHNGYLVHTDDPEEYAAKIASCFEDRGRLAGVARQARLDVEQKYCWQNSAASMAAACRRALTCGS